MIIKKFLKEERGKVTGTESNSKSEKPLLNHVSFVQIFLSQVPNYLTFLL